MSASLDRDILFFASRTKHSKLRIAIGFFESFALGGQPFLRAVLHSIFFAAGMVPRSKDRQQRPKSVGAWRKLWGGFAGARVWPLPRR